MKMEVERKFQVDKGRSFVSSDSETDGDELDEDYDDIRKNIKPVLNLGQPLTTLWPLSLIDHAGEIVGHEENFTDCDYVEGDSLSKSLDWPSGSMQDNFFEPKHRRAPSLPSQGKLEQIKLDLDDIYVTPDEEYGFNPSRARCRSRNSGRRSLSLYASHSDADRLVDFASPRKLSFVLSSSNFHDEKSHARNAEEAKIEEDIASLRAQPSNVEFNRKTDAKKHFQELIRGRSWRKTLGASRSLRRKLSFDSHPRQRSFSEVNRPTQDFYDSHGAGLLQLQVGSSEESITDEQVGDLTTSGLAPGFSLQGSDIKLAPPPILSNKAMVEVLVSNPADKGKKRRASIPQFLTALKLPNKKTIKRFMRKKSERHATAMQPKIPKPFPIERPSIDSEGVGSAEETSKVPDAPPRSPSINTFTRASTAESKNDVKLKRKRSFSSSASVKKNSCSMCSLPKVEEGKETSEFDGTLNRKSCSTCSIVVAKFLGDAKEQRPLFERRMSDTALTFRDDKQPSCSPGRRFILKLLSPVVCGLGTEKYMNFQSCESYTSLASCSSDVSAEADLLSQKLTDFPVQDVAEELALIDKELLIRITWQELATCGWMSINKFVTSPNVLNMVEFFNRVAMMVATSILVEQTAYLRARAISKMIKLAAKCRQLKNYNSLRAVLGGLQCTPIYRLEASWKQVRARRKRLFGELSNLMSETENFSAYRLELSRSLSDPPCIPFLGNFLTQIAQTQAYLAMKRRKSKQRLEKASVASNSEKASFASDENNDLAPKPKRKDSSCENEVSACHAKSPVNEVEVVRTGDRDQRKNLMPGNEIDQTGHEGSFDDEQGSKNEQGVSLEAKNKISENTEKILELTQNIGHDEKNIPNEVSSHGIDEVDLLKENSEKDSGHGCDEQCLDNMFPVAEEFLEENENEACHKSMTDNSSSETDFFEEDNVKLNKSERESIRKSISGITTAMFQTGSNYRSTGNDNEFLEALNEYLDYPEVAEISVFTEIEANEKRATQNDVSEYSGHTRVSADENCSLIENRKLENLKLGQEMSERKKLGGHNSQPTVASDDLVCEDHGVGSTSSYELSPTTPVSCTSLLPDRSPISHATSAPGKNEAQEKKTHARNDSNDSGVVLHNGRSSRASEDLNGSRENICATLSEQHDNLAFDDSKMADDQDVNVEDGVNATEDRSGKTILGIEKALSETRKLEERIRRGKPTDEETKYNKKEFQFWQYQISAMKYGITSRSVLRKFLLNACYNSEDENYSLSLRREPIIKKPRS